MTFESGDRVRLRGGPSQDMSVKLVRDGYALCEAWPGSEINVGAWPVEALELAPSAPRIRRPPCGAPEPAC
jgi:hypothetical protein